MPAPHGCSLDELNAELDAMQTIARALAGVRDQDTRLRILRWTNERFTGAPIVTSAAKPMPTSLAADPTLSVDGMHLFDGDGAPGPAPAREPAVMASAVEQPLDSLLRGFATDFRTLATQWQRA